MLKFSQFQKKKEVEFINEADPGKFPLRYDVHQAAISLAGCRGIPMAEIMQRAFLRTPTLSSRDICQTSLTRKRG